MSRKPYSIEEKRKIVQYIIDHHSYYLLRGTILWKEMESRRVCDDRTWQSMKEHFRRNIIDNLHCLQIEKIEIDRIRDGFNKTEKKPPEGKRYNTVSVTGSPCRRKRVFDFSSDDEEELPLPLPPKRTSPNKSSDTVLINARSSMIENENTDDSDSTLDLSNNNNNNNNKEKQTDPSTTNLKKIAWIAPARGFKRMDEPFLLSDSDDDKLPETPLEPFRLEDEANILLYFHQNLHLLKDKDLLQTYKEIQKKYNFKRPCSFLRHRFLNEILPSIDKYEQWIDMDAMITIIDRADIDTPAALQQKIDQNTQDTICLSDTDEESIIPESKEKRESTENNEKEEIVSIADSHETNRSEETVIVNPDSGPSTSRQNFKKFKKSITPSQIHTVTVDNCTISLIPDGIKLYIKNKPFIFIRKTPDSDDNNTRIQDISKRYNIPASNIECDDLLDIEIVEKFRKLIDHLKVSAEKNLNDIDTKRKQQIRIEESPITIDDETADLIAQDTPMNLSKDNTEDFNNSPMFQSSDMNLQNDNTVDRNMAELFEEDSENLIENHNPIETNIISDETLTQDALKNILEDRPEINQEPDDNIENNSTTSLESENNSLNSIRIINIQSLQKSDNCSVTSTTSVPTEPENVTQSPESENRSTGIRIINIQTLQNSTVLPSISQQQQQQQTTEPEFNGIRIKDIYSLQKKSSHKINVKTVEDINNTQESGDTQLYETACAYLSQESSENLISKPNVPVLNSQTLSQDDFYTPTDHTYSVSVTPSKPDEHVTYSQEVNLNTTAVNNNQSEPDLNSHPDHVSASSESADEINWSPPALSDSEADHFEIKCPGIKPRGFKTYERPVRLSKTAHHLVRTEDETASDSNTTNMIDFKEETEESHTIELSFNVDMI